MKSADVAQLYAQVPIGAIVEVVTDKLPRVPDAPKGTVFMPEVMRAPVAAPPPPELRNGEEPVEQWQENAASAKKKSAASPSRAVARQM